MEVEPYSIIAIDGNRIKKINDRYGHHVGAKLRPLPDPPYPSGVYQIGDV